MIYYELKKVFSRTSNKIAILFLIILLISTCYSAIRKVSYVNEKGNTEIGFAAIQKIKKAKKEWAGELNKKKIAKVIEENTRINLTEEGQSTDIQLNNIAYGWKQGFSDIRDLLIRSYCEFRTYDYYIPDSLTTKDAENFYTNRILHLQKLLNSDSAVRLSAEEKDFLLQKYEDLETPLYYDYIEGWKQCFEYSPTVIMIMTLILGFLVANIFSGEFQLKTDTIFYSSYYGRGKAVASKIQAGFILITIVYWTIMLLYSGIVLGILGIDGANCPIQLTDWISFYNITYFEEYLLILTGGYIGSLFISLLTMLVSAKTKSTILSVIIPFILIFIPSFLSGSNNLIILKLLGLMPNQLLQTNIVIQEFNLYKIGSTIIGVIGILLILYIILSALIFPLLYHIYRKIEIK